MLKKMIKIGLICTVFALSACGGGGTATTATPTAPTTPTPPVNTGTITVTVLDEGDDAPIAGAVVSIGASGTTFKTTDAQGIAVFTGLASGAVDVHVFNDAASSASSAYGINSSQVTMGLRGSAVYTSSVIDVALTLINADVNGQAYIFKTATDSYVGWSNTNTVNISMNGIPTGTSVSGELFATQGTPTSTAGNQIRGATESISLGQQTFTTTTATATPANTALVVNFATVLPTAATLATVSAFTAPGGLAVTFMSVGDAQLGDWVNALTLPDTIASLSTSNNWDVSASNATDGWFKAGVFTTGGTISVAPSYTALPIVGTGQSAGAISWTNGTTTVANEFTFVTINNTANTASWDAVVTGTTAMLTLPTLPAGVTGPLAANALYNLGVDNDTGTGLTIEQILGGGLGTVAQYEGVSASVVGSYTH